MKKILQRTLFLVFCLINMSICVYALDTKLQDDETSQKKYDSEEEALDDFKDSVSGTDDPDYDYDAGVKEVCNSITKQEGVTVITTTSGSMGSMFWYTTTGTYGEDDYYDYTQQDVVKTIVLKYEVAELCEEAQATITASLDYIGGDEVKIIWNVHKKQVRE